MELNELLTDAFGRIQEVVGQVLDGIDPAALAWRPEPDANSIAWLVWHLTRVQDDHVAEIAGQPQVWTAQGWAPRFGLPDDEMSIGYGHSPEEVAAIDPGDPRPLIDYHDAVAQETLSFLSGLGTQDCDRIIDRRFDPPVTVGARLVSVLSDDLQHAGQAAYLRGLFRG